MMRGSILKNKKGLTLLEILVTIGILSIMIAPLFNMFLNAYKNTINSQRIMSGTYITQAVLENCKDMDYVTLASLSTAIQPHDSDGDGTADCYVKIERHPEGTPAGVSMAEKATNLHIIYIEDTVHVLGDDGSYTSFSALGVTSYTLDSASEGNLQLINASTDDLLLLFKAKNAAYPLIIITNLTKKTFGYSNTFTLTSDLKSTYNPTIIEYSNESNRDELICTDLLDSNRLLGVNDYTTALVHLKITTYSDYSGTQKLGTMEETIKVSIP